MSSTIGDYNMPHVKTAFIVASANLRNLERLASSIEICQPGTPMVVMAHPELKDLARKMLPRAVVENYRLPFCFALTYNIGTSIAQDVFDPDTLVLANDDTELLTPSGVDILAEKPEYFSFPWIIGPCSVRPEDPSAELIGRNSFPFIWVSIPTRIWQDVGILDERFVDYGFEDEDWCLRAFKKGYESRYTPDVIVRHVEGASTYRNRLDFRRLFMANKQRFEDKWYRNI